ncbi:augmin complex subunit dgt6 [Zophobas morio]|uniref:augmin complex subunit dgt6 n=1 Tax=Zophobas morio TaxID=2755281 RepID=UPI003083B3B7
MALFVKQLEHKLHDNLYTNIKLLTHFYPTTKSFDEVFKKNMFVKSNKAAFQHVVYYLFTILSPELTKEKITWPLYDVKLESAFRTEVIAFINHINAEYPHANIPNLMASHLMSPGGYKFAKFMLKLSKLVMYEHLRKNEGVEEMLGPVRPHKNSSVTNIVTRNVKARTLLVEKEVEKIMDGFHATCEKAARDAEDLVKEQDKVEAELRTVSKRLKEKKKQMVDRSMVEGLVTSVEINDEMAALERMKKLSEKCAELLVFLSSDKPVLEFKKDDLMMLDSVNKTTSDEISLHHLFNSLNVTVANKSLDMPIFSVKELDDMDKLIDDLSEKYLQFNHKISTTKNELVELSENFSPHVDDVVRSRKLPMIVLTSTDNV